MGLEGVEVGWVAFWEVGGGTGGSLAVGSRALELARAVDFCLLVKKEEGALCCYCYWGFACWLEGGSCSREFDGILCFDFEARGCSCSVETLGCCCYYCYFPVSLRS